MRLPSRDTPILLAVDWLGEAPDASRTIWELQEAFRVEATRRWPGHSVCATYDERQIGDDPLPEVGKHFGVFAISRWLVLVESVADPDFEFALADVPKEVMRRRVGDPWYQRMAYVLVPFANTALVPDCGVFARPWPPCPMNRWLPSRSSGGLNEVMIEPIRDGTFLIRSRDERASGDNWVENVEDLSQWLRDLGLLPEAQ